MLRLLATFVLATAAGSAGAGAFAVLVLGDFDPKFRDSLTTALQMELIGSGVFTIIAAVVACVIAPFVYYRLAFNRRTFVAAGAWGLAYAGAMRLAVSPALGLLDPEALLAPTIAWVYLVVLPALMFVHLVKIGARWKAQGAERQASAL
jgi:hypothetical protein